MEAIEVKLRLDFARLPTESMVRYNQKKLQRNRRWLETWVLHRGIKSRVESLTRFINSSELKTSGEGGYGEI